MNLSENFKAIRTTVQEKVLNSAVSIRAFAKEQAVLNARMFDIMSVALICEDIKDEVLNEAEGCIELYQFIKDTDFSDFSLVVPDILGDDLVESTGLPGVIRTAKEINEGSKEFALRAYLDITNNDGTLIDSFKFIDVAGIGDQLKSMVGIDLSASFPGYKFSFTSLCEEMKNTLSTCWVVEELLNLYNDGQLTIANLMLKLQGLVDLSSEHIACVVDVITSNFSAILASPMSLLNVVKGLLKSFFGFKTTTSGFSFPVDEYHVSKTIIVGWDTVVNVVSTIASAVLGAVNPLIGAVTYLIGAGVKEAVRAFERNESSLPVYPDTADFVGYGQNAKKGFVTGIDTSVIESAFDGVTQIAGVNTPLFTCLISNNPRQNSAHQTLYPIQEFVVPVLPVTAEGWRLIANIAYTGNPVSASYGWTDTGEVSYRTCSVSTSSATASSRSIRISKVQQYMQWLNANPQSVWMPNTSYDNPELVNFAVWLNYVILQVAIHDLTSEYNSLSYQVRSDTWNNLLGKYRLEDICTKEYVGFIAGLSNIVAQAITDHPYDGISYATMSDYLTDCFHDGFSTSGNAKNLWLLNSRLSWEALTNTVMTNELLGFDAFITAFANHSTYADTPYGLTYYATSAHFTPSVVPPTHTLNIWARVLITTAITAAATIVALRVYSTVKMKATRKFANNARQANSYYQDFIATGSKSSYRKWKHYERTSNRLGSTFHLGSVDSMNNWINSPASTASPIIDKISGLSKVGADGDVAITLADIVKLISGKII